MTRFLIRLLPWLGAAASGLLLMLCFPPFHEGWVGWIALTPLLAALWHEPTKPPRRPRRRAFALAYVTGAVFFTGTFHWLTTLAELFESPGLKAVPLLLGLYLSLYFGFWGWFVATVLLPREYRFGSSIGNLGVGTLAASAWVAQEWVRSWLFSGFGWNTLGLTIRQDLPLVQVADMVGVFGLSWLVAFGNVMAVIIVRRILAEIGPLFLKRIRWEFSATMLLICADFAYGVHRMLAAPAGPSVRLQFAMLQPNIPENVKKFGGADEEDKILRQLSELNELAGLTYPPPQLIVWPEATVPRGVYADEHNRDFVLREAAQSPAALLLGSLDYDLSPEPGGGDEVFNGAMLFTDRGKERQSYRKMHLVPWGEYLPLRKFMPGFLTALVPGDLGIGKEPGLLTLTDPPLRLGALVCFEDTLGDLTGRFSKAGADLLINLTNDAWFLDSPGAEQHLANDVLRAVENRRPLLRCTNSGITCMVDPYGRVDRLRQPPFQRGFVRTLVTVPTNAPVTFYARHGDWWAHLSATLTGLWLIRAGLRRRRSALLSAAHGVAPA